MVTLRAKACCHRFHGPKDRTWTDRLHAAADPAEHLGLGDPFGQAYQEDFTPDCGADLRVLDSLAGPDDVAVRLYRPQRPQAADAGDRRLKLYLDLLWNGRIGTYVKATDETHADVGDKGNDAVRVDGAELRVAVIGEGGNLGLTQRGRIEFARAGRKVNTDAVDNSAGVDCSDGKHSGARHAEDLVLPGCRVGL